MPNIGFPELILLLVIALIIFGPGKLPQVGSAIGKAFSEFKKASKELAKDDAGGEAAQASTDNKPSVEKENVSA